MKIPPFLFPWTARAGVCLALMPLTFAASPTTLAPTTASPLPSTGTAAAPKTHVLFMGANIAVEKDRKFHPVEDVDGTTLVIRPEGKPVNVPLTQAHNLQIDQALKISETSVGIEDLKTEQTYTDGADPFRQLAQTESFAQGDQAIADIARGSSLRASMGVMAAGAELAQSNADTRGNALRDVAAAQGVAAGADAAAQQAVSNLNNPTYDMTASSVTFGTAESREMFDAIRLSFKVTSSRNLPEPYCAVIAQIRDRGSRPGHTRQWAYIRSLDRINAGETMKVVVYQGGLPAGYILEGCEVHIYNRGEELATNLSRKRVMLSDDEALEYRIIEYVGANKGRTLSAVPRSPTLNGEVRASLTPAQLNGTYFVRVSKDGRVTGAFRDAAGRQPLPDPALEPALKTLRFNPALEAGKPVESIAAIDLGQLSPP